MYNSYFGFREKPFKLVPNPEYLFLSKSHEIALAHLTYATEQGDGFVVITGEVGTGKTTLCRNYLERLDQKTSSAYIFNPRLESAQLLASICSEFGIQTEQTSIKALLDVLNRFLIEQHAAGNTVVVLIDEAQGLSVENLELLRMLSNLETTRNKLLQIILVGQPELGDQLDSHELRQLAQRISLNYHLTPLSAKESEAYIQHRLMVASPQRPATLFTADACRSAYHFSRGIPRLINIVCDRALLLAYTHNRSKITKPLMQAAIRELRSRGHHQPVHRHLPYFIGGAAVLFVMAFALAYFIWQDRMRDGARALTQQSSSQVVLKVPVAPATEPDGADSNQAEPAGQKEGILQSTPAKTPPEDRPSAPEAEPTQPGDGPAPLHAPADDKPAPDRAAADPSASLRLPLLGAIQGLESETSRKNAIQVLLSLWGQPRPNVDLLPAQLSDTAFIDLAARQYGLRAYAVPWKWDLITQLDLPVILTLKHPETAQLIYLVLTGRQGSTLWLSTGDQGQLIETDIEAIEPLLEGYMYAFWNNELGFDMLIGYGSHEKAILGVQQLLRRIGYTDVPLSSVFDTPTKDAVQSFQQKHSLKADGLVGPLTKIMLLREAGSVEMPHLTVEKRG